MDGKENVPATKGVAVVRASSDLGTLVVCGEGEGAGVKSALAFKIGMHAVRTQGARCTKSSMVTTLQETRRLLVSPFDLCNNTLLSCKYESGSETLFFRAYTTGFCRN